MRGGGLVFDWVQKLFVFWRLRDEKDLGGKERLVGGVWVDRVVSKFCFGKGKRRG